MKGSKRWLLMLEQPKRFLKNLLNLTCAIQDAQEICFWNPDLYYVKESRIWVIIVIDHQCMNECTYTFFSRLLGKSGGVLGGGKSLSMEWSYPVWTGQELSKSILLRAELPKGKMLTGTTDCKTSENNNLKYISWWPFFVVSNEQTLVDNLKR